MNRCPFCKTVVSDIQEHASQCIGSTLPESRSPACAKAMKHRVLARLSSPRPLPKFAIAIAFGVVVAALLFIFRNPLEEKLPAPVVKNSPDKSLLALNSNPASLDFIDNLPAANFSGYPDSYQLKDSRQLLENLP